MEHRVMHALWRLVSCIAACIKYCIVWCTTPVTLVRKRDEWSVSLLVSRKCPPE